jgi:hypothetical protein
VTGPTAPSPHRARLALHLAAGHAGICQRPAIRRRRAQAQACLLHDPSRGARRSISTAPSTTCPLERARSRTRRSTARPSSGSTPERQAIRTPTAQPRIKCATRFLAKYPDAMATDNIGQMPNNSLYHAEATLLLRAAGARGGTLSGRTIDMHVDNPMCLSCQQVLPLIGRELGNPTARFTDPAGRQRTMRNGRWD